MSSQTTKRSQLLRPREYIKAKLTSIPKIGTTGTQGVRNGRSCAGFFLRITQTPAHSITKANSVPMLVMRPTMLRGRNAENGAMKKKNSRFERHGVRNRGWICENTAGTRPSRDIE